MTRESLPLAIVGHAPNNAFASLVLLAAFATLDPSGDVLTGAVIGCGALSLCAWRRPAAVEATASASPFGSPRVDREAGPSARPRGGRSRRWAVEPAPLAPVFSASAP